MKEAGGAGFWLCPWVKDIFKSQLSSNSLYQSCRRWDERVDKDDALDPQVWPWRLLSTQYPAPDLCTPLGHRGSSYLLLLPRLPPPPPPPFFPSFSPPTPTPGAPLVMVHSALVFQHQRGSAGSPGCQSLRQAQPLHLLLPLQRPALLGEVRALGCVACVHTCPREWEPTSVQSPAADQLLTPRKD